jgi:hypothetical protein
MNRRIPGKSALQHLFEVGGQKKLQMTDWPEK